MIPYNPPKVQKSLERITEEIDQALEGLGGAVKSEFQKDVEEYNRKREQEESRIVQTDYKILNDFEKKVWEKNQLREQQARIQRMEAEIDDLRRRALAPSPEPLPSPKPKPKEEGPIRNITFEEES